MHALSIYQTMNKPVVLSEPDKERLIDSIPFDAFKNSFFYARDAVSCAWQYFAERAASEVMSNMECCESVSDIISSLQENCPAISINEVSGNIYELYDNHTYAKLWLIEKQSGEISIFFFKNWMADECMSPREKNISKLTRECDHIDISDFGPDSAAFLISELFSSYEKLSERCQFLLNW